MRHRGGGREKGEREGEEEWGLSREEFGQKVLQTAAKFNFRPPQVTNATAVALEQSSWERRLTASQKEAACPNNNFSGKCGLQCGLMDDSALRGCPSEPFKTGMPLPTIPTLL